MATGEHDQVAAFSRVVYFIALNFQYLMETLLLVLKELSKLLGVGFC
jgi:hypothetical protein